MIRALLSKLRDRRTQREIEVGVARQAIARQSRRDAALRGKRTEIKRRAEACRKLFNQGDAYGCEGTAAAQATRGRVTSLHELLPGDARR